MLQQYSWTQFLVSATILSAIWYLVVLLTAYRRETFGFLSGKVPANSLQLEGAVVQSTVESHNIEHELMGRSKLPEGLEIVSMSALNFSVGGDSAYSPDDAKSDQLGLVPDVIAELKEIFAILAKEDGTKQDFLSLAGMISEKYGRIGSSPNIGHINAFIRDHAPFAVTLQELEHLWD